MEDHQAAGILRACLIRQVPEADDLHVRLATRHTVAAVHRQVERYCRRLDAYAQDPAAPAEARSEASRRARVLLLHVEALGDCVRRELSAEPGAEPADTPSLADDRRPDSGHAGPAGVVDLDAARAARGRTG